MVAAAPCTTFLVLSWHTLSNDLSLSNYSTLTISFKEHFDGFFQDSLRTSPLSRMSNTVLFSQESKTLTQHAALEARYPTCCLAYGKFTLLFLSHFGRESCPIAVLSVLVHVQGRVRHQPLCSPNSWEHVIGEERQTKPLSTFANSLPSQNLFNDSLMSLI